jgi:hypothetical protein
MNSARHQLHYIASNLRRGRYVDAYVVSLVTAAFVVSSLVGDILSVNLRWAVLLSGVGLLVYRVTLPDGGAAPLLQDRSAFDRGQLLQRLGAARELWIFAPTGANVLSTQNCDRLRDSILSRRDGRVKVVLLNPAREAAVTIAATQLDANIDYPVQDVRSALGATLAQLERMCAWEVPGMLEYRLFDFNPGFSLVAVDPHLPSSWLIVEFHAVHNVSTSNRMHVQLTRSVEERWFSYWVGQFSSIWDAAKPISEMGSIDQA